MTEEELNRKMEFIVEQQAQFTVDIQKLQEAHAASEKRMSRLEGGFVSLYNNLTKTGENLDKIRENQQKGDEQLKETRELLNILILAVERHISGHSHDPLDHA
jgi:septal ring factor EnvC (AmiA/AmiB activator)